MSELEQLNEQLWIVNDKLSINEMARIEKLIIVHNDREPGQEIDNLKFAHFHYNKIHFKFKKDCPKNINDLRTMIVFKSELDKINKKELSDLLSLLKRRPTNNRLNAKTVYDLTIGM